MKLRLTRAGKTKQRSTASSPPIPGRLVTAGSSRSGTYNPRTDPSTLTVDYDKAAKWLRQGAQPTDRVCKLLEIAGVGTTGAASPTTTSTDS